MTLFEALQPDSPYVFYSDDHGFCINTADVMDVLTMDKESVIYRQAAIEIGQCAQYDNDKLAIETVPSVEPQYKPVTAEDFAKTMSKCTVYKYMAWYGTALALIKEQGFVICKKTK